MDARNRQVSKWFPRVAAGQVQLPRFQRYEAWGPREVADLLQTVIDELPAGALLVLEIGDDSPFPPRPLSGAPEPTERMNELLLDGQQRLTSLWRSLNDSYPDRQYFVDIRDVDDDGDGHRDFRVSSQSRWWRNGSRYPVWCDDEQQTFARGLVPVRLLRPGEEGEQECATWLRSALGDDLEQLVEQQRLVDGLRARVAAFNLPYLALPIASSEAVVLNVFEKLNTRAVALTAFDIVVARVEGETGESLHDLVDALHGEVPGLARYIRPEDLVLPAACLMQGRRATKHEFAFLDFEQMIADWDQLVAGAARTVDFLEQESVLDGIRIPTEVVLPPLTALWADTPDHPDRLGAVRTLLRRYIWRAFATSRYELAAATAVYQDFQALRPVVRDGDNSGSEAPIFSDPLATVEEIKAVGWPRRRDRLARAVLAVSLKAGALDIADGAAVTADNITRREYHHLFPVAHLAGLGIDEHWASRAVNCALITWRTNRTIAAHAPVDYLRARTKAAALGEREVRARLQTHLVDYDSLAADDYEAFLERRADSASAALTRLCAGEVWP